ncbi:hypothetical protein ACHWQZ_G017775, partial [Mnemiopsis leidyi]
LFEASAFVCLQEIRQPVKHPGFRSFNNTRKTQKHGGVSILVRNDISKGVHQTKCSIEDVVICKLDKIFFNLPSDLFLINAYIKPAQTSCLTSESKGLDSLKDLDQLVNRLLGTGEVLLCGDYNARIGQEPDYIINDTDGSNSFIPISEDYIAQNLLPRNTQDMTSNTYKRPFLDMVINNRLHILNGRTLGDSYGELTCIQSAGASVVDYFIASQESSQYVAHMKVLPFTIFSDHKPLELTLNFGTPNNLNRTPKNINELYEKAPLRYKMNADYLKTLQQTMQNEDHSSRTCRILEKEYSNDKNGAYSLNNDITNHFRSIADSCLQKTKHAAKNKSQSLNKKPWFNTNTAQRATNAQYHDVDVIRRVSVIKLEESSGDTGWDVFTIDYVLNCPLTVIVNQDSRETYLCIFRMLWKTKRIEHGLRRIWGKTTTWDRTLPHVIGDIRGFRHLINIICCEMQHFISQVQYYINFEVLECSWKELENAVNTAENLDHIIEAHKRFLGIVSERLMLNQEHLQVLTKLYANYKNAINFMDVYDKAHEVLKKNNTIRECRSNNIVSNTKQGDWGVRAFDEAEILKQDKEFQSQLKAISKQLTNFQSTFTASLSDFLLALSSEADDSMKFLSLRIDFNEHYKQKHGSNFNGPYINRVRSVEA